MTYEEIYKKLRKEYTDAEIAEGYLIPPDLTEEEEKKIQEEIRELRFKQLRERTEEQRIYSEIMRLRIQMEDYYKLGEYTMEQGFAEFLADYIHIIKKKQKDFAEDISIHHTRLSRILNNREEPNIELAYRLEKHSGNLISALLWWRIAMRKQEYLLRRDEKTRLAEAAKVKNALEFRA